MTAYVIFTRDSDSISDQAEFDVYSKEAPPTLGAHPAKPLAFYGRLDVLEGPAIEGAVVVEFPTMEAARAWYDSPEYQAAAVHRRASSKYSIFIVEGV
jgi:uncharacterized protein (DUF1330 family)